MSTESDTPLTQAKIHRIWDCDYVPADFARELERRCAELEDKLKDILDAYEYRFGHPCERLHGPIDPEIRAARAAVEKGKG